MKKILYVSNYPIPLDRGSNQHAYYMMKALASAFIVYCAFFIQPAFDLGRTTGTFPTIGVRCVTQLKFASGRSRSKYMDYLYDLLSFPDPYTKMATHAPARESIQNLIRTHNIDLVHFENPHYLLHAFHIPQHVKMTAVYHDLYHTIPYQEIRFEPKLHRKFSLLATSIKKYAFERVLDNYLDGKIFLNSVEMEKLPYRSVHVPHFYNPSISYRPPAESEFFRILFVGGYNHPPNRISIRYIVNEIIPALSQKTDRFRIHIVGKDNEKFREELAGNPNGKFVRIEGFKKDVNDIFEGMDIAAFPILNGGGIKTKIIDAMAAGVPVVTTAQGMFGLFDEANDCVSVADDPQSFVSEICRLMDSHGLRIERATKAKEFVARNHSFEIASARLIDYYTQLLG